MPRIAAPTVAEHRERQRRVLLDAARAILIETRSAPSLAATAEGAGLARSSMYRYFSSAEELLAAVVADVFPEWTHRVHSQVEAAQSPGEKVWAYVAANLDLFSSSQQELATALTEVAGPQLLQKPMEAFHLGLRQPLVESLADLGEPHPDVAAHTVEATLMQVARRLGKPTEDPMSREEGEAFLRRLLGPYLQID